ncbi:hypothetical protein RND71_034416 [Anisodus tanguticus]|uniref:Uncharacterized protein n=1 Tax=Anisodus tanguticus TaxID=243964 RepID=A0AAE1RCM1_9SOLA|nr:hypothetical protein RND71_034416 [Anisodus tanguticus]
MISVLAFINCQMSSMDAKMVSVEERTRELCLTPIAHHHGITSGVRRDSSPTLSPETFHRMYHPTPPNTTPPITKVKVQNPNVKWEFMMDEIFASYNYSQGKKMKLALTTFEFFFVNYWEYNFDRQKMMGSPITTWDALNKNWRYHYPKPHEKGYRTKTTSQKKKPKEGKPSASCEKPQEDEITVPLERQKIEMSKGVESGNSRVEKEENVWSDVRELPQLN